MSPMSGIHLDDGGDDHRGGRVEGAFDLASSARCDVSGPRGAGRRWQREPNPDRRVGRLELGGAFTHGRSAQRGRDDSLWLLLDTSPEGRSTDWRPSLTY